MALLNSFGTVRPALGARQSPRRARAMIPKLPKPGRARGARRRRIAPDDALFAAIDQCDKEALAAALADGASANASLPADGWPALAQSVLSYEQAILGALLDAGADPNGRTPSGFTAAAIACAHSQTHLLAILLSAGADPGLGDATRASRGRLATLTELVRLGADALRPYLGGESAESIARQRGHHACAQALASLREAEELGLATAGAKASASARRISL